MSKRRRTWCLLVGIPLAAVLLVIGSVRFEAHFRDRSTPDPPMVGAIRDHLTRPVTNVVSEGIRRGIRARVEARQRHYLGDMSVADTIRALEDESLPLEQRRIHAVRLAMLEDQAGLEALLRLLDKVEGTDKAYLIELLGSTGQARLLPLILELLDDPDPGLRLAAIRALGGIGGDKAVARLSQALNRPDGSPAERGAAAEALGATGAPAARDALLASLPSFPEDGKSELLRALGSFPFNEIRDAIEPFVADDNAPVGARVEVVESLARSTRDCLPYLLGLAGQNASEDVRAAAAWTLGTHGRNEGAGSRLAEMARNESDTMVRRRLFEAMIPQSGVPATQVLELALAEPDVPARVAGFNAAGAAVAGSGGSGADRFDSEAVPDLVSIALHPNSLNIRMRAVFALRRAGTPGSLAALETIADAEVPHEVSASARSGLPSTNHGP